MALRIRNKYTLTNDPSAGSPTEALLRLFLPLGETVFKLYTILLKKALQHVHQLTQSVEATGGVYKGQGLNQLQILIEAYKTFLVQKDEQLQSSIPVMTELQAFIHISVRILFHQPL